jgi:alpha-amylase/alpha-mannosidase (GH57 family)
MATLHVSFLWHYHQPDYRDPVSGESVLPWVRLHAVKDYIGMANLLAEFPKMRQVINFVPSLLQQIEAYLEGGSDTALELARIPADALAEPQTVEIIRQFFQANPENLIHPLPRYRQLLARYRFSHRPVEEVAREFSVDDFRDLQVLANLAWFHPTEVEATPELQQLIEKGSGFSEADKAWVLDRQLEVMGRIIPLYRRLAEAGQIELTTSPFYHALIPLLCNHTNALAGAPPVEPPSPMFSSPSDARLQVEQAMAYHQQVFGGPPRGLWPSEGAISNEAAAVFARSGIEWTVADEEILAQTQGQPFLRDGAGLVDRPEVLYRPYRFQHQGREITMLFRDHTLADLIGFRYQLRPPEEAADDLIARLERIREHAPDDALVVIALDGENCWEYYRHQGVDFLRSLYRKLSESESLQTTTLSDYLDRFGATAALDRVSPGSWINHSFAPWMGHWEKNRAWEHLTRAREYYRERIAGGDVPEKQAQAALREIHIAEGSDWFWWYGDDHTSESDIKFDILFRRHVRQVYELLGARAPDELLVPIMDERVHERWTPPRNYLKVTVDGRRTSFFEWLGAGAYEHPRGSTTMQPSEPVPVTAMYFGFAPDAFVLRLDLAEAVLARRPPLTVELWLGGAEEPALVAAFDPDGGARLQAQHPEASVGAALDRAIEIAAPLSALGIKRGQSLDLVVRVLESGSAVQRIPASGAMPLDVPADPETAYHGAEGLV